MAQYNVGAVYDFGAEGVAQDNAAAREWYRLAAAQGSPDAQTNLGYMFSTADGVPEDVVTAYMWFELGAANGQPKADQLRAAIAPVMTAAEIAQAQARATLCADSGYQTCD